MSEVKSASALRTIGEVAQELDVATHVLRFWESKFKQISPVKRRGRRYYRPEDIRIISQIKALLYGQGYTIKGVQKFLTQGVHTMSDIAIDGTQLSQNLTAHRTEPDLFSSIEAPANNTKETASAHSLSLLQIEALTLVYQGLRDMRERLK